MYYNTNDITELNKFTNDLTELLLNNLNNDFDALIFICIGTDRVTGDSLGPLIGNNLANCAPINILSSLSSFRLNLPPKIKILGTLNSPVHGGNFYLLLSHIKSNYKNPYIVAIDSSLGKPNLLSYISLKNAPLKCGKSINAYLPEIGDVSITGIVNVAGSSNLTTLQTTRLNTVFNLANFISQGIQLSIFKLYNR